ncbi:MAG: 50S ribosomal protein L21 [Egibacteraceae bacterium]
MYAVVATGGKQYRVTVGDTLDVELLEPRDDGTVELRPVLIVGDNGEITAARGALGSASVRASVIAQRKGSKVVVFKYKSKTGYRRKAGHRQPLTRIRIDEISA